MKRARGEIEPGGVNGISGIPKFVNQFYPIVECGRSGKRRAGPGLN